MKIIYYPPNMCLFLSFYISCRCTQGFSTTLSIYSFFSCPDFAIDNFNCSGTYFSISYFLSIYVLTHVCRARSGFTPLLLPVPRIMYTFSWCFSLIAQRILRQLPVSLQKITPLQTQLNMTTLPLPTGTCSVSSRDHTGVIGVAFSHSSIHYLSLTCTPS